MTGAAGGAEGRCGEQHGIRGERPGSRPDIRLCRSHIISTAAAGCASDPIGHGPGRGGPLASPPGRGHEFQPTEQWLSPVNCYGLAA